MRTAFESARGAVAAAERVPAGARQFIHRRRPRRRPLRNATRIRDLHFINPKVVFARCFALRSKDSKNCQAAFLEWTYHVTSIRATLAGIWSKWFPDSGYQTAKAPTFERYGPEFNPTTGMGGFEIWIPIQA